MPDDAEQRRVIRHDKEAYARYSRLQEQIRPELVKARRRRRLMALAYFALLAVALAVAVYLTH